MKKKFEEDLVNYSEEYSTNTKISENIQDIMKSKLTQDMKTSPTKLRQKRMTNKINE